MKIWRQTLTKGFVVQSVCNSDGAIWKDQHVFCPTGRLSLHSIWVPLIWEAHFISPAHISLLQSNRQLNWVKARCWKLSRPECVWSLTHSKDSFNPKRHSNETFKELKNEVTVFTCHLFGPPCCLDLHLGADGDRSALCYDKNVIWAQLHWLHFLRLLNDTCIWASKSLSFSALSPQTRITCHVGWSSAKPVNNLPKGRICGGNVGVKRHPLSFWHPELQRYLHADSPQQKLDSAYSLCLCFLTISTQ